AATTWFRDRHKYIHVAWYKNIPVFEPPETKFWRQTRSTLDECHGAAISEDGENIIVQLAWAGFASYASPARTDLLAPIRLAGPSRPKARASPHRSVIKATPASLPSRSRSVRVRFDDMGRAVSASVLPKQ